MCLLPVAACMCTASFKKSWAKGNPLSVGPSCPPSNDAAALFVYRQGVTVVTSTLTLTADQLLLPIASESTVAVAIRQKCSARNVFVRFTLRQKLLPLLEFKARWQGFALPPPGPIANFFNTLLNTQTATHSTHYTVLHTHNYKLSFYKLCIAVYTVYTSFSLLPFINR